MYELIATNDGVDKYTKHVMNPDADADRPKFTLVAYCGSQVSSLSDLSWNVPEQKEGVTIKVAKCVDCLDIREWGETVPFSVVEKASQPCNAFVVDEGPGLPVYGRYFKNWYDEGTASNCARILSKKHGVPLRVYRQSEWYGYCPTAPSRCFSERRNNYRLIGNK